MDFLSETNHCGQTLLRLVSRGNAIIAELLRLSNHIPNVFYLEENNKLSLKYADILFDFKYLKQADAFENKIESSAVRY
jgi:WASH complex subunit strumpellin